MTTIRKCYLCGWWTPDKSVCRSLHCKVLKVRKYGEVMTSPGHHVFIPTFGSDLQRIVFDGEKSFDDVINFLAEQISAIEAKKGAGNE